jgi:hypothetical protein
LDLMVASLQGLKLIPGPIDGCTCHLKVQRGKFNDFVPVTAGKPERKVNLQYSLDPAEPELVSPQEFQLAPPPDPAPGPPVDELYMSTEGENQFESKSNRLESRLKTLQKQSGHNESFNRLPNFDRVHLVTTNHLKLFTNCPTSYSSHRKHSPYEPYCCVCCVAL